MLLRRLRDALARRRHLREEREVFDEWDRQGWDAPALDDHLRCRVCGLEQDHPPRGRDGSSPTYEFCACCGVEFGYEDASPTGVRRARKQWLDAGAKWRDPEAQPADWSLDYQLALIPVDWRD